MLQQERDERGGKREGEEAGGQEEKVLLV